LFLTGITHALICVATTTESSTICRAPRTSLRRSSHSETLSMVTMFCNCALGEEFTLAPRTDPVTSLSQTIPKIPIQLSEQLMNSTLQVGLDIWTMLFSRPIHGLIPLTWIFLVTPETST
jgi:hypothetical protein